MDQQLNYALLYNAIAVELHELLEQDWRYREPQSYLPIGGIHQLLNRPVEHVHTALKHRLQRIPEYLRGARSYIGQHPERIPPSWLKNACQQARAGAHYLRDLYRHPEVVKKFQNPSRLHPLCDQAATALDEFFQRIPRDSRYHLELRTDLYLRDPIFEILEKHGVGQVLSHWTWLPPLRKQLTKAGGKLFNAGKQCVIRLLTPLGMRYEDSYAKAFPFDKLVEGMLRPEMILEAVDIMWQAINQGVLVNVIINNRAGGNAPLLARLVAEKFLKKVEPAPKFKKQLNLW